MAENTQFGITGIKGYVNKSSYPYTHTQVNYYPEIIFLLHIVLHFYTVDIKENHVHSSC